MAAALLGSCAKVEAIKQDEDGNYPNYIQESPVLRPETIPEIPAGNGDVAQPANQSIDSPAEANRVAN